MIWKIIVLAIVTVVWLFELFLLLLSVRSKNNPVPESVRDVYDEETYRRRIQYSADKNRLGMLKTTAGFLADFLLLLFNGYAAFAGHRFTFPWRALPFWTRVHPGTSMGFWMFTA